ncbi:MAG: hypothetical protein E7350_02455 [Clostridiales bacterium]|nr:hypothetical protein [Clostridiales bacterium]
MRRLVALFGVCLLVMGIRLYNNGLLGCGYKGEISVGEYDPIRIEAPLLIDGAHRIDIDGADLAVAEDIVDNLCGKVVHSEKVDGIQIIYAYCLRLGKPVEVFGQKVNLMVAVKEEGVAAGTPLLYGSY